MKQIKMIQILLSALYALQSDISVKCSWQNEDGMELPTTMKRREAEHKKIIIQINS